MSSKLHRIAAGAALLALTAPNAVQARACMKAENLADAVVYSVPVAYDAFTAKCGKQLPKDGFIARNGTAFVDSYRAQQEAAWPGALQFLMTFIDGDRGGVSSTDIKNLVDAMPPELLRPIVDEKIAMEIGKSIKTTDCGRIERVLEPIAPLPPENLGQLVATILELAPDRGREPRICRAEK